MILKNKMLNICNLIQFESSYAAYFNPCKCQLKLITEVETWRRKYKSLNSIKMISFPNSLCFECIDKNECHHIQPLASKYQFFHTHSHHQYKPIWDIV